MAAECVIPRAERRYLFTGGGTGGHVYPSIVIADHIRSQEPDAHILFVGVRGGAEGHIIPARGYTLLTLPSHALPNKHIGEYLSFLVTLFRGIAGGMHLVLRHRPHVILGTGGYASAPLLLAGILLKRVGAWKGRILIHEQNIVPGRLNASIGRMADIVAVSFRETLRFFPAGKSILTGYPVRKEIKADDRDQLKAKLGIPPTAKVILAFGGSSGARVLNEALWNALPELLRDPRVYVLHSIGHRQGQYDPQQELKELLAHLSLPQACTDRYRWKPYVEHIEEYYAVADLVICRAGAGTIMEVAQLGIPAVLIPKANLPGDHQVKNARFLERMGIARIMYERPRYPGTKGSTEMVEGEELASAVQGILDAQDQHHAMATGVRDLDVGDATTRIYGLFRQNHSDVTAGSPSHVVPAHNSHAASGSPFTPRHTPIEWMSTARLVEWMEAQWKNRSDLSPEDVRYVHYQTDRLLANGRWQDRNMGVKLAGLSRYSERLPLLTEFITDRTSAPVVRRFLGGDFLQVGFIRRNALQAIWRIRHYDATVRSAFLCGLEDPYYEVRSWTARAICRMSESVGEDEAIESLLRRNLQDRWFEVIVESAKALGKIACDQGIFSDAKVLLQHHNWKVRDAALACLTDLLLRNIVRVSPELEEYLQKVQTTCLDFSPYFPIQKTLKEFQRILYEKKRLTSGTAGREAQ